MSRPRVLLQIGGACVATSLLWGLWLGLDRSPADAHAVRPWFVPGQAAAQAVPEVPRRTLTLVAFNIHSGRGRDGVTSLPRTTATLGQFDVAGLFEVRGRQWWRGEHQAEQLASLTSARGLFLPTERQSGYDHFGNAVLDRTGELQVTEVPLNGTRGKAFRTLAWGRLPWVDRVGEPGTLSILMVHIDSQADRQAQLDEVLDLFCTVSMPVVLLGDFNTRPSDPALSACVARDDVVDLLAECADPPARAERIDGALGRGVDCLRAELIDNDASDHPLIRLVLAAPASVPKAFGDATESRSRTAADPAPRPSAADR